MHYTCTKEDDIFQVTSNPSLTNAIRIEHFENSNSLATLDAQEKKSNSMLHWMKLRIVFLHQVNIGTKARTHLSRLGQEVKIVSCGGCFSES